MSKQMTLLVMPDPDWIALLRAEVIEKKRSITDVAREINMPRPSLSLLLSGNYPAKLDRKTKNYAHKVVALYANRVLCPHVHQAISDDACRAHASAPMSTSDPVKLRQWAACRSCQHNPAISPNREVTNAL